MPFPRKAKSSGGAVPGAWQKTPARKPIVVNGVKIKPGYPKYLWHLLFECYHEVWHCHPWGGKPVPSEKTVQLRVKTLLLDRGYLVYDTSQFFRAAITHGVPDLIVFGTTQAYNLAKSSGTLESYCEFFFVECKRPGAKLSPEQVVFHHLCVGAGIFYVYGGVKDVGEFLGIEMPSTRHQIKDGGHHGE